MITQANVEDVIKAGALTTAEICKGIESDVREARSAVELGSI